MPEPQVENPLRKTADILRQVVSGVLPYECPGCGLPGSDLVCASCMEKIVRIGEPYCKTCGRPLPPGVVITDNCIKCGGGAYKFDAGRAAFVYDPPISGIVKKFKFSRKNIHMGDFLGKGLADFIEQNPAMFEKYAEADFICPVPLHTLRFFWRGFNQSELLARHASDALGVKVRPSLVRKKNTTPQSRLTMKQRQQNVRGAFAVKKGADVRDMRIVLMDDVMTTGATLNECSRVLKKAGAAEVLVLTAARRL